MLHEPRWLAGRRALHGPAALPFAPARNQSEDHHAFLWHIRPRAAHPTRPQIPVSKTTLPCARCPGASREPLQTATHRETAAMADEDYDDIVKSIQKLMDEWGKAMDKIAKDLSDIKDEIDKMDALQKQKAALQKDADAASKALAAKIFSMKLPPKADPKQMIKLPDFIIKNFDKNGVKLGDYGSLKPDVDIDIKQMKFKKVGATWTWTF
jgi:hypothetical protein